MGREKGTMRKREREIFRFLEAILNRETTEDRAETLSYREDPSIEYFYMYEIFILAMRLVESRFIPYYILSSHPLRQARMKKF